MLKNKYAFTNADYEVIDEKGNTKGKVVHMLKKTDYHSFLKHNLLQTLGIMIDTDIIPNSCYGLNIILGQYRRVEGSRSSNKLKAVRGMWNLYRQIEYLPLIHSCYYFIRYAIYALWKRIYI